MKLKDLLKIDFQQEIEAVIKVGEYTEDSATEEINNYIVTEKIAEYIDKFIDTYERRKKETGIWLSGFYGSGKSYFAKIIGYLLANPSLKGVSARELFKQRLVGLPDQYLLENKIQGLDKYKTKVISFDLSGQSKTTSFFVQLLLHFLDAIGLSKDAYGYTEYQLMKTDKYHQFLQEAEKLAANQWPKKRTNTMEAPQIIKKAWSKISGESEQSVAKYIDWHNDHLKTTDAERLVQELSSFLEMDNDYERIIFIVDEVSEAIEKEHLDIAELRGAAQHLSENGQGKFWFIATAQEKLDNVLNQRNITKNDINIITDRFQLKIHLSSEEVDKVIRERLLLKTDAGKTELNQFYEQNEGKIKTLTNLSGKFDTSIESVKEFVEQYPFFRYQMSLLGNFLFSVFQQAKSGGSERGMLVTVDKILKEENLFEQELGNFVTSYQLAEHGLPMPPSELVTKMNNARKALKEQNNPLHGRKLMETIYFLEKSNDLKRTVDNITKAFSNDLTYIGDIKPDIEKALNILEENNFVLEENNEYRITSDTEEALMQEMMNIDPNWQQRLEIVRNIIKDLSFITPLATATLDGKTYEITIKDEQDTLLSRKKGEISLTIFNILNVDRNIDTFLENIKEEYVEHDKTVMIPDIDHKDKIDKTAIKVHRYTEIVRRHRNSTDSEIRNVIKTFDSILSANKDELEKELRYAYTNGWLIYDFREIGLGDKNIINKISEIELQMIKRSFEKRLHTSVSENLARQILKTKNKNLKKLCPDEQFAFFDRKGNFIGNNLRIVDEITNECKEKSGSSGRELEDKFTSKPYGWSYGDIAFTLAALLRAGYLKIKHNGTAYRDYKNRKIQNIFENIHRFRKAKFYIVSGGLSSKLKQQVVDKILEIDNNDLVNINYNQNDYEIVSTIPQLAKVYDRIFNKLKNKLEPGIIKQERHDITVLKQFTHSVDDSNLKEEAQEFLNNINEFSSAIQYIKNLDHFVDQKYERYKEQVSFLDDVKKQINQINDEKTTQTKIMDSIQHFNKLKEKSVIDNLAQLTRLYTEIRQAFNQLFKKYYQEFIAKAKELKQVSEEKKKAIEEKSVKANTNLFKKISNYINTCSNLLDKKFELSETQARDKETNKTLTEIIGAIEIYETRIEKIKSAPIASPSEETEGKGEIEITLPKETENIAQLKRKLTKIIKLIDENKYDKFVIRIE